MFKKIYIIIFVSMLITSCGKKGDPVYNDENKNTKIFSIILNKLA
ncbi:hypothetical protein N9341_02950 [Candidatus Pelagibacter sp.]|nr:hypothetical protein [Candidatus Pelagibacter sp.]